MQETIDKLLFNLDRSEFAYQLYIQNRKYYQALRIFKANTEIYTLLINNSYIWDQKAIILEYIFHLEDWLEQFQAFEKSIKPTLDDEFVFSRLEFSFDFPKNIAAIIRGSKL